MAKIKLGAIVVGMSGKLGGHVFATNKGGAYMRTKTTPNNPQTSYQSAVRATFAQISSAWSSLTAAQRASWNSAVDSFKKTDIFGDLKVPTGKALHQRLNQNLLLKGSAILTLAPNPAEVLTATLTSIAVDDFDVFDVNFASTPASGSVLVYTTPSLSQGTEFVKNKLRYISTTNTIAAGSLDIGADNKARHGAPTLGSKVFIGIRFMNAGGQVSPMQIVSTTVTAA